MRVQAAEPIYGGIDYGGKVQAVTAVEVGEAQMAVEVCEVVAEEEGQVEEVVNAIEMTSLAGGLLYVARRAEG